MCVDNASNDQHESPVEVVPDPASETGDDYSEFKAHVEKELATLRTTLNNLCGQGNLIFGAVATLDLLKEIDVLRKRVKDQSELINLLHENVQEKEDVIRSLSASLRCDTDTWFRSNTSRSRYPDRYQVERKRASCSP